LFQDARALDACAPPPESLPRPHFDPDNPIPMGDPTQPATDGEPDPGDRPIHLSAIALLPSIREMHVDGGPLMMPLTVGSLVAQHVSVRLQSTASANQETPLLPSLWDHPYGSTSRIPTVRWGGGRGGHQVATHPPPAVGSSSETSDGCETAPLQQAHPLCPSSVSPSYAGVKDDLMAPIQEYSPFCILCVPDSSHCHVHWRVKSIWHHVSYLCVHVL